MFHSSHSVTTINMQVSITRHIIACLDTLSLFWLLSSVAVACAHFAFRYKDSLQFKGLSHLLDILKSLYYFGKLKEKDEKSVPLKTERKFSRIVNTLSTIPKSHFSHFYVSGLLVHSAVLSAAILYFVTENVLLKNILDHIPNIFHWYRQNYEGKPRNAWPVILVLVCEEVHLIRRAYECLRVSSFSKGTISIVHYFYGVTFYILFGLGVLTSSPVLNLSISVHTDVEDIVSPIVGICGFLVASYYQHKTMRTFANLRLKEKDLPPREHYIPRGHLFTWVSSPHYLCEIVIYLSLCTVIGWQNPYLVCATMFVITNQISASLSVHQWYRKAFANYPQSRKAIMPFVL